MLLSDAAKKLKAFTVAENGAIIKPQNTFNRILVAGQAVNTKMRMQKQRQHIWNSKEFTRRTEQARTKNTSMPSAFYESVDIETLVLAHMGKGTPVIGVDGTVSEYFSAEEHIGMVYLTAAGTYAETSRVCIRYSKDGWHAFPVKEVTEK